LALTADFDCPSLTTYGTNVDKYLSTTDNKQQKNKEEERPVGARNNWGKRHASATMSSARVRHTHDLQATTESCAKQSASSIRLRCSTEGAAESDDCEGHETRRTSSEMQMCCKWR
jgi:hypothetical protein